MCHNILFNWLFRKWKSCKFWQVYLKLCRNLKKKDEQLWEKYPAGTIWAECMVNNEDTCSEMEYADGHHHARRLRMHTRTRTHTRNHYGQKSFTGREQVWSLITKQLSVKQDELSSLCEYLQTRTLDTESNYCIKNAILASRAWTEWISRLSVRPFPSFEFRRTVFDGLIGIRGPWNYSVLQTYVVTYH